MIELTEKQGQAVAASTHPVSVVDPKTHRRYVLLSAKSYERMRKAMATETVDPSFFEFEEPESQRK